MNATKTEITELDELSVVKVAGVETPANGTPFLLMKAVATQPRTMKKAAAKASVTAAVTGALSGVRSHRVAKSNSAESDRMQSTVTGEGDALAPVRHPESGRFLPKVTESVKSAPRHVQAAAETLRDPLSNQVERRIASSVVKSWAEGEGSGNGGEVTPTLTAAVDASDIGVVGSDGVDPTYIAKCRRALRDPNLSPEDRELIGQELTKACLMASHEQQELVVKAAVLDWSPAEKAQIAKLEKAIEVETDPSKRDQAAAVLSYVRLVKAAANDGDPARVTSAIRALEQQEATNAAVRQYQQQNTHGNPATIGQGVGVDSQPQVAAIGSGLGAPQGLGAVDPSGNRGDNLGRIGRGEPDVQAVAATLENELAAKGTDPIRRARAGEELTLLKLRAAREGVAVAA